MLTRRKHDFDCRITPLGGPTLLIEIDDLCVLVDPVLGDSPECAPPVCATGQELASAFGAEGDHLAEALEDGIDCVLVTDPDHLDQAGLAFALRAPTLMAGGDGQLPGAPRRAFEDNAEAVVSDTVLIWAVTPSGAAEEAWISGFWINAEACAIHIAGDRTTAGMVREYATATGPLWAAVVRSGAVRDIWEEAPGRHRASYGGGDNGAVKAEPALTAAGLAEAACALGLPVIVLAHPDAGDRSARVGAAARRAFEQAGIGHALVELRPGEPIEVGMGEGQVDPTRWPST